MNKLVYLIPVSIFLSGCTLFPSNKITGNAQVKAEKLAEIISRGGQASCIVNRLDDGSTTQMIISGKKMKILGSDFGDGKKGTMINDGTYTYMWDDVTKTGIKTKINEQSPTPSVTVTVPKVTSLADQVTGYEDETKYSVDCTTGAVLDSEFVPPTDVEFTDLNQMMRALPTMPDIPNIQLQQ